MATFVAPRTAVISKPSATLPSSSSDVTSTPKKKWSRGLDWTPEEETRLSELCKEHREMLDGDFKGASNSHIGSDLTNAKKLICGVRYVML